MPPTGYNLCLRAALYELADRLTYLGYYGDSLNNFIRFLLSQEDLDAYSIVVAAADAAGFDIAVDRINWAGRGLPGIEELPLLPDALEASIKRYLDSAGRYSLDAQGRFTKGGGNS